MRKLFFLLALVLASCSRPDILTMFVGTYSDGFYAYEFDQKTGSLVGEGPIAKAEMTNPSYLAVQGNKVYAVSEMPDATSRQVCRSVAKTPVMSPRTAPFSP